MDRRKFLEDLCANGGYVIGIMVDNEDGTYTYANYPKLKKMFPDFTDYQALEKDCLEEKFMEHLADDVFALNGYSNNITKDELENILLGMAEIKNE